MVMCPDDTPSASTSLSTIRQVQEPDNKNLDVKVKVGGQGSQPLYFLYEGLRQLWDFSHPDLHNDTFGYGGRDLSGAR